MRYHFDINISSGQGEAREWFPRDASGNLLGTGKVYFEMVSCREWSGWKYGAKVKWIINININCKYRN